MFKKYAVLWVYVGVCLAILGTLLMGLINYQKELSAFIQSKPISIESCILPPDFNKTTTKTATEKIKYVKKIVVIKVPERVNKSTKKATKQESLLACLNEYKACQSDLWCNARGCEELRAYWKGRYGK